MVALGGFTEETGLAGGVQPAEGLRGVRSHESCTFLWPDTFVVSNLGGIPRKDAANVVILDAGTPLD
jgi:hypothetical protein